MNTQPASPETPRNPFPLQRCIASGEGLQVITATDELFNHVDANEPMWAGTGARSLDLTIPFIRPFAAPPAISAGLSGIDASHSENLRFNLSVEEVSETAFVLRFVTWDDTHIARASASWTAIGREALIRKPGGGQGGSGQGGGGQGGSGQGGGGKAQMPGPRKL
ncbi:MAG: H-type lectin domain-containing protein [Rhodobacteraceae bacterium]|nr:H-type lectin domain-containing protein [Paracoccaceae bacterium]